MEVDLDEIEHTAVVTDAQKDPFWKRDKRIAEGDTRRKRLKAAVEDARKFRQAAGRLSPIEKKHAMQQRSLKAALLKAEGKKELLVTDLKAAHEKLKTRRVRTSKCQKERRLRKEKKDAKRVAKKEKLREAKKQRRQERRAEGQKKDEAKLAANLGRA